MVVALIALIVVLYLLKQPKGLMIEIEHNNIRIRGRKLMAIHDFNVEQKVKITAIPNHGGYDATSFVAMVTEGDAVVTVEAIAGELLSVYVKPLAVGQAIVSLSILSHNGSLLSGTVEFNVTDLPATSLTIEVSDPEPL